MSGVDISRVKKKMFRRDEINRIGEAIKANIPLYLELLPYYYLISLKL